MGCEASKSDVSVLSGSNERAADLILEVPGVEVDVISGSSREGGVVARGQLNLLRLRPTDQTDGPGRYVVDKAMKVGQDMIPGGDADAGSAGSVLVQPGTFVEVTEAVEVASHNRIRARIKEPPGWISLLDTQSKLRWAKKLEVIVFHVGGEKLTEDDTGFYYPMTESVPVLLVYETRVMTVSAGDGDSFAIRLPQDMPEDQLQQLIQVMPQYCDFRLSKQKDVADYVDSAAGGIAEGIAFGASLLEKVIQKSGTKARESIQPQEEVKISAGTQMAVGATAQAAVGTVAVAGTVMDGLLNTAVFLGKQVGKQVAAQGGGASSAAAAPAAPESAGSKAGKAALVGGLQVFDALLKASDKLSKTAADETAGVVGHKYGAAAGSVARDGMKTAGAALELKDMVGKKAVGKLAAKGAMYTAGGMIEGAVEGSKR